MTVLEQRLMECATTYFAKQNSKHIDWEQRRYEIAKEVLPTVIGLHPDADTSMINNYFVKCAVSYADALIEELKK